MPDKTSKWKIVSDIGMPDNGSLSVDQEHAEHNYVQTLAELEQDAGVRLPDDVLVQTLISMNEGLDAQSASNVVMNYRNNPHIQQQVQPQQQQPVVPEIENPVSQEDMLNIDSTVEPEAMSPTNPMRPTGKYKGEHKKKKKKGDKRHLKGKGPAADKANEVYHAIMRDRKEKGEPSKEEQASAAAIAWSQAKKTMKKKAYFRGEEAQVLDSYRGMWGEDLVRLSVQNQIIDVPRDSIEFVSAEVDSLNPVEQLKSFVSYIDDEANTREQIQANITNLKTAKDIARKLLIDQRYVGLDENALDAIYSSCENRIEQSEQKLATSITSEDVNYLDDLPKYEIARDVVASNFSRNNDDWMDDVLNKMAAESEEIDVDKLMHEDPIIFVASLSEEIIGNSTAVRNLALSRVNELAGPLDEDTRKMVVSNYLDKTERIRQSNLLSLKTAQQKEVQEAQYQSSLLPDEGLFT